MHLGFVKYFTRSLATANLRSPCQEPAVRWFYATDIPISKPFDPTYKITTRPQKFLPFIQQDSDRLESKYRKLQKQNDKEKAIVTVNEDGLFSVDLKTKIMEPTYWKGPTYEVRRGIWFLENKEPIPDLIAEQIEELYQKYRPDYFLNEDMKERKHELPPLKLKSEKELFTERNKENRDAVWTYEEHDDFSDTPKMLHLRGPNHAILTNQGQLLPTSLIENLGASNSVLGIYHITRGYTSEEGMEKEKETAEGKPSDTDIKTNSSEATEENDSSILNILNDTNLKFQNMMENDFSNTVETENSSEREIDHLIFCIHGIGQTLSTKYLSINFAHDCNHLRHLLKTEFVKKPKTFVPLAYKGIKQDQNYDKFKNCKVQVLPIIWRHAVHFGLDYKDKNTDKFGYPEMPLLSNLNVEGVTPLRNLTADVVLDVLLYYEPMFKDVILNGVAKSLNETYDKYLENHPNFKGKISIIGHSLGSAIALDLLNIQKQDNALPGEYDNMKQLKFPVENFFALGSPNGVFKFIKKEHLRPRSMFAERNDHPAVYPKVSNMYNVFYASDVVAYRMEPLIHSYFSQLKPKPVEIPPDENIINDKIQDIKATTDSISNTVVRKIIENTSSYLEEFTKKSDSKEKKQTKVKTEQSDEYESAVRKYVSDLAFQLNKNGRVDYVLPQGLFDIDIINAVVSHIGYFDDPNVADFILCELWKKPSTLEVPPITTAPVSDPPATHTESKRNPED
ncbi:hypothetical protein CANINC_000979 [Pichia inconspicua]|uniref:DDHD domain-containing protein n=1 Tax=Pichia inconspicua TaxID=52247 RepID=A0A4T0X4V4_9ASCO|nr:hypothetical protein CANINC_000979 [[Candida] inconspicua]